MRNGYPTNNLVLIKTTQKMKTFKKITGIFAFTALSALNFTHADNLFAFNNALASNSSSSSSTSSNTSTSNSCCSSGILDSCIKKVYTRTFTLQCERKIVKGDTTIIEKYELPGIDVSCPPIGSCNVCVEYRTTCD